MTGFVAAIVTFAGWVVAAIIWRQKSHVLIWAAKTHVWALEVDSTLRLRHHSGMSPVEYTATLPSREKLLRAVGDETFFKLDPREIDDAVRADGDGLAHLRKHMPR